MPETANSVQVFNPYATPNVNRALGSIMVISGILIIACNVLPFNFGRTSATITEKNQEINAESTAFVEGVIIVSNDLDTVISDFTLIYADTRVISAEELRLETSLAQDIRIIPAPEAHLHPPLTNPIMDGIRVGTNEGGVYVPKSTVSAARLIYLIGASIFTTIAVIALLSLFVVPPQYRGISGSFAYAAGGFALVLVLDYVLRRGKHVS